ncbi:MAG TPA: hypothetical protein ENO21_01515, partial [Firmicutes bacterium]|nr:hypothetical protein [Bacillota bacterium]
MLAVGYSSLNYLHHGCFLTGNSTTKQERFAMRQLVTTGLAIVIAGLSLVATAAAQEKGYAGMLRYPDVSQDHITFVYDNDVWIADKAGGMATPLSSPAGQEMNPRFSPDGTHIAFTANYDGNFDVYEIPINGGTPLRLTYGPSFDRMIDYSPDGRAVFNAYRDARFPHGRLFYAGEDGGAPEALPPAYAFYASFDETGEWLAFAPWTREYRTWNRYQGGTATDIWLFNLSTLESSRITDHPGTDDMPMFHGSKVYYLSDAGPESRRNIWVYDTKSGKASQVTHFTVSEVKWPAIGPEEIV